MQNSTIQEAVEGLWTYRTLQIGDGTPIPMNGLFFFQHGQFLQEAIVRGEPLEQMGMGHSGHYRWEEGKIHLNAEVGMVVEPGRNPVLERRSGSVHHVSPRLAGNILTLDFGHGVVQVLERLGAAGERGEIIPLRAGALALIARHFILVAETPEMSVTGKGTFQRNGNQLRFAPDGWFTVTQNTPCYHGRGIIDAEFDGRRLVLPGGTVRASDPFTLRFSG